MKKKNSGKIKMTMRRLLALFLIWTLYIPNNVSQYIGTAPMEAEAAEVFTKDNVYLYCDGKTFYIDGVESTASAIQEFSPSTKTIVKNFYVKSITDHKGKKTNFNDGGPDTPIDYVVSDDFITVECVTDSKEIRIWPTKTWPSSGEKDEDIFGHAIINVHWDGTNTDFNFYYKKIIDFPTMNVDQTYDGEPKSPSEFREKNKEYTVTGEIETDANVEGEYYKAVLTLNSTDRQVWSSNAIMAGAYTYESEDSAINKYNSAENVSSGYTKYPELGTKWVEWRINPSDITRTEPVGIDQEPCISITNNDGKITGLSKEMEFGKADDSGAVSSWTSYNGLTGEQLGIEAGRWAVRYKGRYDDKGNLVNEDVRNWKHPSIPYYITVKPYRLTGRMAIVDQKGNDLAYGDDVEYGSILRAVVYQESGVVLSDTKAGITYKWVDKTKTTGETLSETSICTPAAGNIEHYIEVTATSSVDGMLDYIENNPTLFFVVRKKPAVIDDNIEKQDIEVKLDSSGNKEISNGKIIISDWPPATGLAYEYADNKNFTGSSVKDIVSQETEIEKEGVYWVRTKETDLLDSGEPCSVTINTYYEISFDVNDDEEYPASASSHFAPVMVDKNGKKKDGTVYKGPSSQPSRSGGIYEFAGWFEAGGERPYEFGNNDVIIDAPVRLTAKWIYLPLSRANVIITKSSAIAAYGETLTATLRSSKLRDDDKVVYFWWERNGELVNDEPIRVPVSGTQIQGTYTLGYEDVDAEDGSPTEIKCYVWSGKMLEEAGFEEPFSKNGITTVEGTLASDVIRGVSKATIKLIKSNVQTQDDVDNIIKLFTEDKEEGTLDQIYTIEREYIPDDPSADVRFYFLPSSYSSKYSNDPAIAIRSDDGGAWYATGSAKVGYSKDEFAGDTKDVRMTSYEMTWLDEYEVYNVGYDPTEVYEIDISNLTLPGKITPTDQTVKWNNDEWGEDMAPTLSLPRQMEYTKKELLELAVKSWTPDGVVPDKVELTVTPDPDSGYDWNDNDQILVTPSLKDKKATVNISVGQQNVGGTATAEYNAIVTEFYVVTNDIGVQSLRFDHSNLIDKNSKLDEAFFRIETYGEDVYVNYIDAVEKGLNIFENPVKYSNSDGDTQPPNPGKYPITYTSSDRTVATVDRNSGKITLIGVGSTTITASIPYDGKFLNKQKEAKAATASYVLTVTATNVPVEYLPHFAVREAHKYLLVGNDRLTAYTFSLTYTGAPQTGVYGGPSKDDETYKRFYTLMRTGSYYTERTNAGAYEAMAKLNTGYAWPLEYWVGITLINERNSLNDIDIYWEIAKSKFADDFTLTGESPSTDETTDGMIIVADRDRSYGMEYNGDGSVSLNWQSFTGNAVTDLAPGTYWVRYSGDSNHYASDAKSVTIYPTHKIVYYTRVSSFTGYASKKYFDSDALNARVDTSESDGQTIVVYWPEDLLLQEPGVVEMPADWYYASPSGWIIQEETADDAVPSHWRFDEDYADRNYTLNADWQPKNYDIKYYDWNVNEFDVAGNPDTYNIETGTITLTAPYRSGYKFMGWTSEELGILTPTTSITFDPVEFSSKGTLKDIKLYTYWRIRAATPVADPAGGRYTTTFDVELTCATPGAVIYYTVDGSEPNMNKRLYVGSIPVNKSLVIKAIAYADDMAESEIMSAVYTIVAPGNASGVTGIIVQPVRMSMIASSSNQRIEAELIPENAEHGNLVWTSADTKIVQVTPRTAEGSLVADLTPLKAGTTTVTVREENSGAEGRFTVIVARAGSSAWVPTQAIKISATTLSMRQGGTTKLTYAPVPSNATDYMAKWKSSDKSVATVTADGTVTAVGQGKATIKLEATTYGYPEVIGKQECVVTVDGSALVQGIVVEPKELELAAPLGSSAVGESAQLMATVYPGDAEDRTILWSADKPGYVRINADGVVTALKEGEVFITASSADGATDEDGKPISATIKARITQAVSDEDLADYKRRHNDNEPSDELWIGAIGTLTYTGSAIKPEPNVYYGAKKLEYGTDYTFTYSNNIIAAGANDYTAPTVTAVLKGSYSGSVESTFTIAKADISKAEICNPSGFIKNDMEMRLLKPTIIWQGKTLKLNRDYTIEYTDGRSNAYFDAGVWDINVTGAGNFSGSVTAHEVLTYKGSAKNLARASATSLATAASLIYDGTEKRPSYQLSGVDMSKVQVAYKNNINAGKATVIFTSNSPDYYGKKTVTFKIKKCNIVAATRRTTVDGMPEGYYDVAYVKGGVKPKIGLSVLGGVQTASGLQTTSGFQTLTEGRDFKVKYKNYTKPRLAGVAVVKGKGNYTGTLRVGYTVYRQDINNLYIIIDDVLYSNKARAYRKVNVTVRDVNGKKLKKNKDYKIPADSWSAENDTPSANSTVGLTITGVGTYTGSVRASFRVISKSQRIKNAEVSFRKYENGGWVPYTAESFYMTYNGGATVLTRQNIVLANGEENIPSASLEVVGFKDNTRAGTATAYVKALGTKYGGLKEVKFKIARK